MSEAINWRETPDKDKVRLILERVMGYYILPDSEDCTIPDRRTHPAFDWSAFHWPVASWDGGMVECWQIRDIVSDSRCFDPLHDMNDVKLLRVRMAELHPLLNLHVMVYTYNRCYAAFSLDLPVDEGEWSEGNGEYCLEEAVCIAALRAVGCEVLV